MQCETVPETTFISNQPRHYHVQPDLDKRLGTLVRKGLRRLPLQRAVERHLELQSNLFTDPLNLMPRPNITASTPNQHIVDSIPKAII